MGEYTYADFKEKLTLELWNRDNISSYVGDWVNAAYMDLATRNRFWDAKLPLNFEFPELNTSVDRTTGAHEPKVNKPAELLHMFMVFDNTNNRRLYKMSPREYFEKVDRTTTAAEGQPINWTRYGTYLYLWPTPAAAYSLTLYYRRKPALLSADTDTTVIGAEWDEVLLKLAVIQSMMRLKQYENAALEKQEWIAKVMDLIGIYTKENLDEKHVSKVDQIYHRWGYDGGGKR